MPFLHPLILLTGLGLAAAPVIVHLLNRRRHRVLDWAAMQFLMESVRLNRRRLRLEELLLLALRTFIVLLLAAGLARFTGCASVDLLGGSRGDRTVVFVLDDSYSMGQRWGGTSLFEVARGDLVEQIRQMPATDRLAIVLASNPDEPLFDMGFNVEGEDLAARVEGVELSAARASFSRALARADAMLTEISGPSRVVILSDFRRVDLDEGEDAEAIALRYRRLRERGTQVACVDYGRVPQDNLTLEGIELLDRFVVTNMPARLRVTVRNNAPNTSQPVELTMWLRRWGGDEATSLPAVAVGEIPPGEVRHAEIPLTPRQAGPVVVEARLPADELAGDNVARLALQVRPALNVLLVDGRHGIDPRASEAYFVRTALDPYGDVRHGVAASVTGSEALGELDFEPHDVVFLLDVAQFPVQAAGGGSGYPALERLESYVRGGGGLVVFLGDRANVTFYNGPLFNRGMGLSPFQIAQRRGDPRQGDRFVRLDSASIAVDSLLGVFSGEGSMFADLVRFNAFTPAEMPVRPTVSPELAAPRVLARFSDPDRSPAVVARRFGQGEVVFFYSTASTRWTDWPIDPVGTFADVMHGVVGALARRQPQELTGMVGEGLALSLGREWADADAILQTPRYPAQEQIPLRPAVEGQHVRVLYDRASDEGIYLLNLSLPRGQGQQVLFARNPDPRGGDLTPGGRAAVASVFADGEFQYAERTGQAGRSLVQEQRDKEYWMILLAAALGLMALETHLGRRFGHYG